MSSSLGAEDGTTANEPIPSPEASASKEPATAQEATAAAKAAAAPKGATTPQVEIIGHYQTGIETSDAASEGSVTYKLIEDRPILRRAKSWSSSPA